MAPPPTPSPLTGFFAPGFPANNWRLQHSIGIFSTSSPENTPAMQAIVKGEKTSMVCSKNAKRLEASLSRPCCLYDNAAWEKVLGYCSDQKNIFVLAKYFCNAKLFRTEKMFRY